MGIKSDGRMSGMKNANGTATKLGMVFVPRVLLMMAVVWCTIGCEHRRIMGIVNVKDIGPTIVTKNRYRLVGLKIDTKGANYEMTSANVNWQRENDWLNKLIEVMPQVFAEDGIPVVIRQTAYPPVKSYEWSMSCPYVISLTTLPAFVSSEYRSQWSVDVVDGPKAHAKFEWYTRNDSAFTTITPFPLLLYVGDIGTPSGYENCRKHTRHSVEFFGSTIIGATHADSMSCIDEAMAYGIAATLKQMEDDGLIDLNYKAVAKAGESSKKEAVVGEKMELLDFKREPGYEHHYSFALRFWGEDVSLRESRGIQKAMRAMIREDYVASFPSAKQDLLVVDFPQYMFDKGHITGRAVVLTLRILSLEYDPNSRRGVIGIRVGPNQYEDARIYVRKSIEELVRDKNIALVTGKIPPNATFYLLDETLRDNIMKVEFRTE